MRKWITIMDYCTGTISIYEVSPDTDEEAWIVDNTDFNTDEIHWMSSDRFPSIHVCD